MATGKSGTFEIAGTRGFTARVSWAETYDIASNQSTVSITSVQLTSSQYYTTYWLNGTISINGTTVISMSSYEGTHSVRIPSLNEYGTVNGSMGDPVTVTHDSDGRKSIAIAVDLSAANSQWVVKGSETVALTDIPRVSVPTVSAASVRMGESLTITTNRKATSFTHKLTYSFGNTSGTIATGVGDSYTWTVPDLVSKIPNQTSGICTITCETFSGSTSIGSSSVTVALTVPTASAPTASSSSATMKSNVTISTNRKSTAFKHKLIYSFGNTTGDVTDGYVDTSFTWTIPDLAHEISGSTYGDCTITCITYNGTAEVGRSSVKIRLNVPAKSTPTTSANSVQMGQKVTIYTNRNSSNFTHKLTYSCGSKTGEIGDNVGTSYIWTVPDLSQYISGATSGKCTITCITYNGSKEVGTASIDITLTVLSASKPTVSANTVQMGGNVTINTNRKSESFTHTLTYSFGGSTGTIATKVGASYTWTVPDLASKIPNQTSGKCTITCQAYNGSAPVGIETVEITLTVPAASTPTTSAGTVQMGNSVTISTNRNSTAFTHTLTYSLGGSTGTIATNVTTSCTWSVPDLVAKIPNQTSGTCTITCQTYNGTALVGSATKSITLTVLGASEPTVSANTVQMGGSVTISTNRKSSAFTHTLTYSFGGSTGTIATSATSTYSWTVPDLAARIPNQTSSTCTITCQTYNGTALVGSDTVTITVTVPDKTKPTTSVSSVSMNGSVTISTNRKSTAFTHTLTYSFGNGYGTIATDVTTSYTWTVPDLVSQIPNKTSGTCTITCKTYNGSALVGSDTVSITLNVPAASTPITSADTVQMGGSVTISTNRKSAAFTHTITYSFGGSTGTIATNVATSFTWTVPDLSANISGASSGTCTITCRTYNGTALVGSATKNITLTVLSVSIPTVSARTVQMGNSVTIYTNRNSSAYTHKITWSLGSQSGTLATAATTSVSWTPSKELAAYTGNKTSATCTITCETYNGTARLGAATVEIELLVPNTTVPTVNAASVDMGGVITINTPRETTAYTHDLTYTMAGYSGEIAKNVATSYQWTVPLELASKIPNDTSAVITVTCTTKFSGSSSIVGTFTVSFTAIVPNNSSTTSSLTMTLRCVSDLPSKFAGIYVEGKTKVEVTYRASSDYSNIVSYDTTIMGTTGTGNPFTSGFLTPSGSMTISGAVTDARGFITQKSETITVVPYSRPRVAAAQGENSIVCARCDANGRQDSNGTYLLLKAGRKYSAVVSGGSQKNYCTLTYRHKTSAAGEEGYSNPITLLGPNDSSDYVSLVIPNIVSEAQIPYTVQIIAEDDIGERDVVTLSVSTSFITAHAPEGGHGLTIGGFHDPANVDMFECWFDARFRGEVLIGETGMTLRDYILSVISEGG